ncbi:hypothetical protein BDD12DRAFT_802553 [Trichophaea hybrida]|nr:hypothetical protein BDD12DRAFT_802553 [Trichophaea hybrida]
MRACTAKPVCITINSPPSSPPQPHASNDNHDSDENNYCINIHDGSRTLLGLSPLQTIDEILFKAVASMNKVMETYHVQGDIDNYEDLTPANTDTGEKYPETKPNALLGYQRLSPMMTPTAMRGNLIRKAKYTQADPSDSSCDAEEGATIASNLQRMPKDKRSGSNNYMRVL